MGWGVAKRTPKRSASIGPYAQEAFARLIEKGHQILDDAATKKQLTVIGRNYYFNAQRHRQTEMRNRPALMRCRPSFFPPDQEDRHLSGLLCALDKLVPLERHIVDKRHSQSFADIAFNLGRSESWVRRIHKKALARLRRMILDDYVG